MSKKSNKKNKNKNKSKGTSKKTPPSPPKKESKTLDRPIILTTQEATLIYELMHDVKLTYMNLNKEEKAKPSAKEIVSVCNGIMKKVEDLVLGPSAGEGKGSNGDKEKS